MGLPSARTVGTISAHRLSIVTWRRVENRRFGAVLLWLKGYSRERSEIDTGVSRHHVHHRKPFRRGASQRKMPSSHRAVRGVIIPKRQPNLFHRLSCGFPVSIDTIQPVEPGSHRLPNSRLARGTTSREDPEPPPQIATALAIVSSDIRTAYDPRPRRRGGGGGGEMGSVRDAPTRGGHSQGCKVPPRAPRRVQGFQCLY